MRYLLLALSLTVGQFSQDTKFCGTATGHTRADLERVVTFCHRGSGLVGLKAIAATGTTMTADLDDHGRKAFAARLDGEFVLLSWVTGWRTVTASDAVIVIARIDGNEVARATVSMGGRPVITWRNGEGPQAPQ